jgi:hypothetical protein
MRGERRWHGQSTPSVSSGAAHRKVPHVAWGTDLAAQLLCWAASDEHGRVLIGKL